MPAADTVAPLFLLSTLACRRNAHRGSLDRWSIARLTLSHVTFTPLPRAQLPFPSTRDTHLANTCFPRCTVTADPTQGRGLFFPPERAHFNRQRSDWSEWLTHPMSSTNPTPCTLNGRWYSLEQCVAMASFLDGWVNSILHQQQLLLLSTTSSLQPQHYWLGIWGAWVNKWVDEWLVLLVSASEWARGRKEERKENSLPFSPPGPPWCRMGERKLLLVLVLVLLICKSHPTGAPVRTVLLASTHWILLLSFAEK